MAGMQVRDVLVLCMSVQGSMHIGRSFTLVKIL